ncbi:bromodomain protein [Medicago truncatula]|uniref:Bromodomain protein n=1 Tax=Medicago truncatula TaxID=3880 RepID=G7L9U8_MEDTR|nr:bromodomain protein [Medicago truncatula]
MTRLRKLQKVEGERRSPRISCMIDNVHSLAFRTEDKKRTKLRPPQQHLTASTNQGVKHEDIKKKNVSVDDQPSTLLPEKQILELVLDTLQRKDTYEIFAEPVDPNEVENYYTIVKQPMDFGTMRAKLHEGMYKTLQQFEHDVFLIFNNAMNFNPPGTIYFKQARVIGELAKKVFDVLRTDPEKFEIEFSETRQQVAEKLPRQVFMTPLSMIMLEM